MKMVHRIPIAMAFAIALVLSTQSALAAGLPGTASMFVLTPITLSGDPSIDFGKVRSNSSAVMNPRNGDISGPGWISGGLGPGTVTIIGEVGAPVSITPPTSPVSCTLAGTTFEPAVDKISLILDLPGLSGFKVGGNLTTGSISGMGSCNFTITVNY